MTVRGDLVYDHRGGEIVGFVNPETWNFKKVITLHLNTASNLPQQYEPRNKHACEAPGSPWSAAVRLLGLL